MKTRTRERGEPTQARRLRTRDRKEAATNVTTPEHVKTMRTLAKRFYAANLAKNEQNRIADKARKELLGLMQTHKMKTGKAKFTNEEGEVIPLDIEVIQNDLSYIDIAKLKKMVTPEVFLACVSPQIGLVTAAAGKNVLNAVTVTEPKKGKVEVYISAAK